MVISENMQNAVNQQLIKAIFHRYAGLLRLLGTSVCRNYDVAQQVRINIPKFTLAHGKGDDIGGPAMIQIRMVHLCDAGIIHDQYRELTLTAVQGV